MKLLLHEIASRTAAGESFAVSTVVETVGSSPREVGASMALAEDGSVLGSLSGGCLEAEVLANSEEVLRDGTYRTATYGPSDSSELFAIGLTCGGLIDIVTRRFGPEHAERLAIIDQAVVAEKSAAIATLVEPPDGIDGVVVLSESGHFGTLGTVDLDRALLSQLPSLMRAGWSGVLNLGADGRRDRHEVQIFVESFTARPTMLIVGAIDAAEALSRLAHEAGYNVTVVDPRSTFVTTARFPRADRVVAAWPQMFFEQWQVDERSAVCVLTHDPRIDVPVLMSALRSPASFVGAMGSQRTHFDRLERLEDAGATTADLARLRSPIGLDIGAATPTEIALSILAEIVAVRSRKSGEPMRDVVGVRQSW